jgi:hypothetical protein
MSEPTTTGSASSRRDKIEARVQTFVDTLEEGSRQLGLPQPSAFRIDPLLELSEEDLMAMSLDAIATAAIQIARYAYFVQDVCNQRRVIVHKCDREIRRLVAHKTGDYREAYRYEDKLELAARDNDVTRELLDIRDAAAVFLIRWEGLHVRLSDLSKRFDNLIYARRGNHG